MEKHRLESSCAAVLQGMAGRKVVVEMRDEQYVIGILESCDSNLNMRMKEATVIRNAEMSRQPEHFVLGKHVRFVHFENTVNVEAARNRCRKQGERPKGNRRLDQKQFDSGKKSVGGL